MVKGPAIIIINHQSNFDSFLQGPVFPINTVIIGKKELGNVPLWGHLFKATNNIMIDRDNRDNAVSGIDAAVERFAHGTIVTYGSFRKVRARSHARWGASRKGAFYMAVDAKVPIIPIVTKQLHYVLDMPNKIARGGIHEIKILPPNRYNQSHARRYSETRS